MVKVYANPELLPMFNLWLEQYPLTGYERSGGWHDVTTQVNLIHIFIQALDEGSNWSNYDMWSVLDEYYGDNPDYNWWKRSSNPLMAIIGLETSFGRRENIQEKLAERIKSDSGWDEPLFEAFIDYYDDEEDEYYEERLKTTPDALRKNGEIILPLHLNRDYVTLISLGDYVGTATWFNSIYFTLHPGDAWPKPKPRNRTINHPGGIK